MSHLAQATFRVLDAARNAGLRATVDPRSLNPPCVIVEPTGATRRKATHVSVDLIAHLVAPGPTNADALLKLSEMAGALTPALDEAALPWSTSRVSTYPSPSSGEPLMSYDLAITASEPI